MNKRNNLPPLIKNLILCLMVLTFFAALKKTNAKQIQFNMDILDVKDRENFDIDQFSRQGYVMPGVYSMAIQLNEQNLPEQNIEFININNEAPESIACLNRDIITLLDLKEEYKKDLKWIKDGQCLNPDSLSGIVATPDLRSSTLYISVPQSYLKYSHPNWDQPVRWEQGLAGFLFDYNLNLQSTKQIKSSEKSTRNLSANGIAGVNAGPWRFRGDWQAKNDGHNRHQGPKNNQWKWNRIYAFRSFGEAGSKLTIGENFLNSSLFDSFRFTGVNLISDDSMLPPNLRGYAPEVTGVARTNARVVISQLGRVIKEVQVASGPFRIQDLSSAVNGTLDIVIEEQDGSEQHFQVETSTVPYLTRPGLVRYNASVGKASDYEHNLYGPIFTSIDFSWGVTNGWSLFGGLMGNDDYQAVALGLGRDFMVFGAISADIAESRMRLIQNPPLHGRSFRINYTKRFELTDSQLNFSGYRFSNENFTTMSDYLNAHRAGTYSYYGRNKEMYTLTLSQRFNYLGLTAFLNYNNQVYWDHPESESYTLSFSKIFDMANWRGISISMAGYRHDFNGKSDQGGSLTISLPLSRNSRIAFNEMVNRREKRHSISFNDRIDNNHAIQIGMSKNKEFNNLNGYYNYSGEIVDLTATASWIEDQSNSWGVGLNGGLTITNEGSALHRTSVPGGTRMVIDTQGAKDVPVGSGGQTTKSNYFGKAVISDLNNYTRQIISIDVTKLPDTVEALRSITQATLTEGAIGYRSFDVLSGAKAMAVIRRKDGSSPPFGSSVYNENGKETGIMNDDGIVYLSGIKPDAEMQVHWGGKIQCIIKMPKVIENDMTSNLFLPCER